jgi:hypothetical protein
MSRLLAAKWGALQRQGSSARERSDKRISKATTLVNFGRIYLFSVDLVRSYHDRFGLAMEHLKCKSTSQIL